LAEGTFWFPANGNEAFRIGTVCIAVHISVELHGIKSGPFQLFPQFAAGIEVDMEGELARDSAFSDDGPIGPYTGPVVDNLMFVHEHGTIRQFIHERGPIILCERFHSHHFEKEHASRPERLENVGQNIFIFTAILEIAKGSEHAQGEVVTLRSNEIPHVFTYPLDVDSCGPSSGARFVEKVTGSIDSSDREASPG